MAPRQVSVDPLQDLVFCLDKSVVPQRLGNVTQVLWTTENVRRELETGTNDENLRNAILLHFSCAQSRASVSAWPANEISESERQLFGSKCLCHESHVPTVCGTTKNDGLQFGANSVFCLLGGGCDRHDGVGVCLGGGDDHHQH